MGPQEAFAIIEKEYPLCKLRSCLDFGTFFVFSITPMYVKDDDTYYSGTEFDAIDKRTGRHFFYDITSDFAAYQKAKEIPIDTLWNTNVAELINKLD